MDDNLYKQILISKIPELEKADKYLGNTIYNTLKEIGSNGVEAASSLATAQEAVRFMLENIKGGNDA